MCHVRDLYDVFHVWTTFLVPLYLVRGTNVLYFQSCPSCYHDAVWLPPVQGIMGQGQIPTPGRTSQEGGAASVSAPSSSQDRKARAKWLRPERFLTIVLIYIVSGSEWRINIVEQQLLTNTEPGVERPPDVNGDDQRYTHVHGEFKPWFYC